ncbi:hypothetical protein [Sorangium sp. So ce117]|uniref:hypothetical protein n=1 Tax=Sorangium sp. So ce117 TaxID=3133277 RepID=UPI003F5DD777
MRVFTAEQVEVLRERTRLGPKPELVRLEEVARRAGYSMRTIRRRLGAELSPCRKLVEMPRARWGFAPQEAEQITAWAKLHVRNRTSH